MPIEKTKTCSNGHQEISFKYISEIEECPLCRVLEEIEWLVDISAVDLEQVINAAQSI